MIGRFKAGKITPIKWLSVSQISLKPKMTSFNTKLQEIKLNGTRVRNFTDIQTLTMNFENMPRVSKELFLKSEYYI